MTIFALVLSAKVVPSLNAATSSGFA
jgi:hypothetical protein